MICLSYLTAVDSLGQLKIIKRKAGFEISAHDFMVGTTVHTFGPVVRSPDGRVKSSCLNKWIIQHAKKQKDWDTGVTLQFSLIPYPHWPNDLIQGLIKYMFTVPSNTTTLEMGDLGGIPSTFRLSMALKNTWGEESIELKKLICKARIQWLCLDLGRAQKHARVLWLLI